MVVNAMLETASSILVVLKGSTRFFQHIVDEYNEEGCDERMDDSRLKEDDEYNDQLETCIAEITQDMYLLWNESHDRIKLLPNIPDPYDESKQNLQNWIDEFVTYLSDKSYEICNAYNVGDDLPNIGRIALLLKLTYFEKLLDRQLKSNDDEWYGAYQHTQVPYYTGNE